MGHRRHSLDGDSDAMNPEARRADRPSLEGSKSRNRLSELRAWPVFLYSPFGREGYHVTHPHRTTDSHLRWRVQARANNEGHSIERSATGFRDKASRGGGQPVPEQQRTAFSTTASVRRIQLQGRHLYQGGQHDKFLHLQVWGIAREGPHSRAHLHLRSSQTFRTP